MAKVFISHSTKDHARVEREIVTLLHGHGIDTWFSHDDIRTASNWERTIAAALDACEWFLLVMSPHSAESEWVKDEVHWAIDRRPGKIVPVLLADCDPRAFHLRLARIQYVDFTRDLPTAGARLLATWGITPKPAEDKVAAPARPAAARPATPSSPPPTRKLPTLVRVSEVHRFTTSSAITSLALSADSRLALSGCRDGKVHVWDLAAKSELACLTLHFRPVGSVHFFPDCRRIVSSSADGSVRVANLDTGKEVRAFEQRTSWAVALSHDGTRALSGMPNDTRAILWEVETGKELDRLEGHTDRVRDVAFAADGRSALSSSRDGTLRLWDLACGLPRQVLSIPKVWLTTICFAGDSGHAWTGNGRAVSCWELAAGREVTRLEGHTEDVLAVAPSVDGRWLASAGADETARLWDLKTSSEAACLRGHVGEVLALAIARDLRHLVTGGEDRTLRLWRLDERET